MKSHYIRVRLSKRRSDKLRMYAAHKDKTITSIIEDFIDSLPIVEIDQNSAVPKISSSDR